MEGNIKWMRAHGVPIRAVAPILVEDFLAWSEERGEDPEEARAAYAAHRLVEGEVIPWLPRPQQALLVRVGAQVQEVLRDRPGSAHARAWANCRVSILMLRGRPTLSRLRWTRYPD
jgi:hypothetical protein